MFRKDLIHILLDNPMPISELAELVGESYKNVEDDLRHMMKSIKHEGYKAAITPAECKHCGFKFHKEKLQRPGKCPLCRETWISEPLISIKKR